MSKIILEARNLTKKFGEFIAVNSVSFSVKEGEVVGFLGPNGAGKTTTIQMLLGVLTQTSGDIFYFGKDLNVHREEIMEKVNFSSTYTNLPWNLTVKENLTYISYLYAIKDRRKRIERLIEIFRLDELLKKQMHQLSAGQQTRVNLAKALINFPKVLLLDEPTSSLDPETAKYIRDFLQDQRREFDVSILVTSHNMAEVEEMCDRVIFISEGKIIADNKPDQLAKTIEICHIELRLSKNMEVAEEFCKKYDLKYITRGKYILIDIKEKQIATFLQNLTDNGILYEEISIEKPTLEDFFIQQTIK